MQAGRGEGGHTQIQTAECQAPDPLFYEGFPYLPKLNNCSCLPRCGLPQQLLEVGLATPHLPSRLAAALGPVPMGSLQSFKLGSICLMVVSGMSPRKQTGWSTTPK